MARDRVENPDHDARSRPVDLDQVSARLLQAAAAPPPSPKRHTPIERRARRYGLSVRAFLDFFPHVPSSQDPSTPVSSEGETPEAPYVVYLRDERQYYDELVRDGGRPWYPISLLDDVSKNPDKHREMLRYWQGGMMAEPDQWAVYGPQLIRWRDFRGWQAKRRKVFRGRVDHFTVWATRFLRKRHDYTAPVEFAFDEDPKQQDHLTTWIEYLAYECNIFTKKFDWHRHRLSWYEGQWEQLADSGVLRPHETAEIILSWDASLQRSSEETQAENAVKSARKWAQQKKTAAARAAVDSAVQARQSIKNRHDRISEFIATTRQYREAKRDAERHGILMQWVKDQVPLIMAEMAQAKADEGNSDAGPGENRGVKRARDDEDTESRDSKRQKHDGGEKHTASHARGEDLADQEAPSNTGTSAPQPPGQRSLANTKPGTASKPVAQTRSAAASRSPPVAQAPRRSARQTTLHSPSKDHKTPRRTANTTKSSTTQEPLRRSARVADRQRRSGVGIEMATPPPPRPARRSRKKPGPAARPPVKAARVAKRKSKK